MSHTEQQDRYVSATDVAGEDLSWWLGDSECVYCGHDGERVAMVPMSDDVSADTFAHYACLRDETERYSDM